MNSQICLVPRQTKRRTLILKTCIMRPRSGNKRVLVRERSWLWLNVKPYCLVVFLNCPNAHSRPQLDKTKKEYIISEEQRCSPEATKLCILDCTLKLCPRKIPKETVTKHGLSIEWTTALVNRSGFSRWQLQVHENGYKWAYRVYGLYHIEMSCRIMCHEAHLISIWFQGLYHVYHFWNEVKWNTNGSFFLNHQHEELCDQHLVESLPRSCQAVPEGKRSCTGHQQGVPTEMDIECTWINAVDNDIMLKSQRS